MQIGILETGKVNDALAARHGSYPEMFETLLRAADARLSCQSFAVVDEELPATPEACDAWLITGSKHGVYDDLSWIEPLEAFLRAARAARQPIIGVCFGHQILAEAFGGRAEKSDRGWGCGVHRYELLHQPGWMGAAPARMAFHAMHQDQVTAIPPDATVLAASDFCPYAMLTYGDPEAPYAISIQPHPEFGAEFAKALVEIRAGALIPPEVSAPALESFGAPVDNHGFAEWCRGYLRRMAGARDAA